MLLQRLQTLNIWRANDCSQALCLLIRLHGTIRALNHTALGLVAQEGLYTLDLRICTAKADSFAQSEGCTSGFMSHDWHFLDLG